MVNIRKIEAQDCELVAKWIQDEFIEGRLNYRETEREIRQRVESQALPCTLVAEIEGKVIGTASLLKNDFSERENLKPWLAQVYVDPDFRKGGIASALCEAISKIAMKLGFKNLYLQSKGDITWFIKQGWTVKEDVVGKKYKTTIGILDYKILSELSKLNFMVDAKGGIENLSLEDYIKSRKQLKQNVYRHFVEEDYERHRDKEALVKRKLCSWCKNKLTEKCNEADANLTKICESLDIQKEDFSKIQLGYYLEYELDWLTELSKKLE